jgi:hypothetical protein
MSHPILSDKFCQNASLSTLIYYNIVILLHNTFIEAPHHHCFSSLPVYFLLLILTSLRHFVLRSRFLFLLQTTISTQQRTAYSFIYFQFFISIRSFAVLSVTYAEEGIRSPAPRYRFGGSPTLRPGKAHTQLRFFGCSITTVLNCIHARLAQQFLSIHFESITHFISICIIHCALLAHSFTVSRYLRFD